MDIKEELDRLIGDVSRSRLLYSEGRLTYSQIEERLRAIAGNLPDTDKKEETENA